MKEKVLVAKIVAAHGIKGQVKIKSYCDNYVDFNSYGDLLLKSDEVVKVKKIGGWKKDVAVCTLDGVDDRNMAEELRGKELFVFTDKMRSDDEESSEDEFYIEDLKDCEVFVDDYSNDRFGMIHDVQDFGAGDLLEILPEGEKNLKKTLLVPFSNDAIVEVDLDNNRVLVDGQFIVR
ncbi:MAG: ribosome maturation factor RimM [Alphaproteobacteria bacterium]|jgi:16S rRNA processing protein RimM|nr:ribosome maturation factor RimM [Alphaproteobacteria bacterium]